MKMRWRTETKVWYNDATDAVFVVRDHYSGKEFRFTEIKSERAPKWHVNKEFQPINKPWNVHLKAQEHIHYLGEY